MVCVRISAVVIRSIEEGDLEQEILLVRHRRRGRSYSVLPGGKIENGETLDDALFREGLEETGFELRLDRLILVFDVISPENHSHALNLVVTATVTGGEFREASPSEGEPIERGDRAYFAPMSSLSDVDIYPPIAAEIIAAHAAGFPEGARYLGDMWRDFDGDDRLEP